MTGLALLFLLLGQVGGDSAPLSSQDSVDQTVEEKSPGKAVLLSFLIPGGGQIYTRNYWKAALIAPAEVALGYLSYQEELRTQQALRAQDTSGYIFHRDRRNSYLFWTGAVIAFSMADAYVSAYMFGFDRQLRLSVEFGRVGLELAFR